MTHPHLLHTNIHTNIYVFREESSFFWSRCWNENMVQPLPQIWIWTQWEIRLWLINKELPWTSEILFRKKENSSWCFQLLNQVSQRNTFCKHPWYNTYNTDIHMHSICMFYTFQIKYLHERCLALEHLQCFLLTSRNIRCISYGWMRGCSWITDSYYQSQNKECYLVTNSH